MRAYFLAVAILAGVVAGCSQYPEGGGRQVSVTSGSKSDMAAMAGGSVSGVETSAGSLLTYDRSAQALRKGASIWHPIRISEQQAIRAIVEGGLYIEAPDGEKIRLDYERHVEHPSGNWTWVGRTAGANGRQAVITFGTKATFGSITDSKGMPLQVTTAMDRTWLVETDARLLASGKGEDLAEADFVIAPVLEARRAQSAQATVDAQAAKPRRTAASATAAAVAGTTVDVVVGYTNGYAARLGGQSQAQTRLDYLIALANNAYADSLVDGQLRLVRAVQVNYPDNTSNTSTLFQLTGVSCVASNTGANRLPHQGQNCTSATRPAALEPLAEAREQYGADLVALIRPLTVESGSCGVSWLLGAAQTPIDSTSADWAFSVVSDTNGTQDPIDGTVCREEYLAHEMGHNMGLQHDRLTAQGSDDTNNDSNLLDPEEYGRYPYSFGHSTDAGGGNFYTLMSLRRPGQTGYRVFSNPAITICGGQPCGVPELADNARALAQTMPLVAGFRATAVPLGMPDGDFDGDAKSDILWRNSTDGKNVSWRSANSATPQAVSAVPPQAWKVVGTGDFNGDGQSDVVWRNSTDGKNAIWRSANSATPQVVSTVPSQAWKVAGIGDFNGDGLSDILWRNSTDGKNVIWRSAASATPQLVSAVPSQTWKVAGIGDFNGDGLSDILWRNSADGKNAIWRSGNSATPQAVSTVPVAWTVAGVGDFDGDGISDILWRNTIDGKNAIWRSGSSAASLAVTAVTNQAWKVAKVGDFDGDGRSDILWRFGTDGRNVIWKSGNSATQQAVSAAAVSWAVAG
jgi:peptidyl-Asp metalloendopeptidase